MEQRQFCLDLTPCAYTRRAPPDLEFPVACLPEDGIIIIMSPPSVMTAVAASPYSAPAQTLPLGSANHAPQAKSGPWSFCEFSLKHSRARSFTYHRWLRHLQICIVMTETVWPTKQNIYFWSVTEKFCDHCSKVVSFTPHRRLEKPTLSRFTKEEPGLREGRPRPVRAALCPAPSTQGSCLLTIC